MKAPLTIYAGIVRTAVYKDRPHGLWPEALCLLGLIAVNAALTGIGSMRAEAFWHGTAVGVCLCVFYFWYRYLLCAVLQNTPTCAQLVPAMNRRIRQTSLLFWCVCMTPLAVMSALLPSGVPLMLAVAIAITGTGASVASTAPVTVWAVVPVALVSMLAASAAGMLDYLTGAAGLAVLFMLCVGFAVHTVFKLFPSGGDRHITLAARQKAANRPKPEVEAVTSTSAIRLRNRCYAMLLRRDLARPVAPGKLMLHALGPAGHSLAFLPMLAGMVIFGALVIIVVVLKGTDMHKFGGLDAFLGYLYLTQVTELFRLETAMLATRGEQALVKLTPGAPGLSGFNHELGKAILKGRLTHWLLASLIMLGMLAISQPSLQYILVALSLAASMLPVIVLGLRDFAGMSTTPLKLTVRSTIGSLAALAALAGLIFSAAHPALWAALMLVFLTVTLVWGRKRWRAMLAAPPAYPVCRTTQILKEKS